MGLMPISHSTYERPSTPTVGRVVFDSQSEREAMAARRKAQTRVEARFARLFGPVSLADIQTLADIEASERAADTAALPNPNPKRFTILRMQSACDRHLVALVHYPDCTNYEGRKILVFADTTMGQLVAATELDPHFTDRAPEGVLVPVARFEPTERGWRLAMLCAWAL